MKELDVQSASERLARFKADFRVDVIPDWGYESSSGAWQAGFWTPDDLDRLYDTLVLFASTIGGKDRIVRHVGDLTIQKSDMGSHGGEARPGQVSFSKDTRFSEWTVVHEMAHAWDAHSGWKLSRALERYTRGFTSPLWAQVTRRFGLWDAGLKGAEKVPGRYGRKPGCNAARYFYGDKPSGSNWLFNRKEDFAEAVAMYVGWDRGNKLSDHAQKRIIRYSKFKNGEKDDFGVADNWQDYARYFYPDGGDYTKTKRWKFVDDLVEEKIVIG